MSAPASLSRSFPAGKILAGLGLAALGFGLGHLLPTAPLPDLPPPSSAATAPAGRAAPVPLPGSALTAADFPTQLDGLLTVLASADRAHLLAALGQVTAESSGPPVLRNLYRRELIIRLVALGASRDAMACGDARDREEAARLVVERVAKTDPDAALALIDDSLPPPERRAALEGLMGALGETDPERGLQWLRARPELRDGGSEFFRAWTRRDPRRAAEAILAEPDEELASSHRFTVAYEWGVLDVEAARAWAESLPPHHRPSARMAIMNSLVNRDPAAALAFALAHPENGDQFAERIGARLGGQDAASADALLARVPPGQFRTRLIGGIVSQLVTFDPAAALEWTKTLLPGERASALRRTFDSLAFEDPVGAIRLARQHLTGRDAAEAIVATAAEWSKSDFPAALAALAETLPGEDLKRALPDMMSPHYSIFGQDPADQVAAIRKLGPELQTDALRQMGSQWGMVNPDAPGSMLASLVPEERAAFLDGWLLGIAGGSAEFVKRALPSIPPGLRATRAAQITRSLASEDPAAAADFLLGLDAPLDQRQSAMEMLVSDWTTIDPAAATAFAQRVPPGAARDAVTLALARRLKEFAPDDATRQLVGLSDPAARTRLIEDMVPLWRRVDPARGRALLLAAARTDAERNAINVALGNKP